MRSNASEIATGFLELGRVSGWKEQQETRGAPCTSKTTTHPWTAGIFHRGHPVGRRHLVGDPDAVAGRGVLRADGGVRPLALMRVRTGRFEKLRSREAGHAKPVEVAMVSTVLSSMSAVAPPAAAVRRHLSARTEGVAPSASSSRYMVVPRFQCLSWIARSR